MIKKSEEWAKRISEQRKSGESITSYCGRTGVSKSSFEYWRRKLGHEDSGRFVSVAPVETKDIIIQLGGGIIIRVPEVSLLPAVLEVLNARA